MDALLIYFLKANIAFAALYFFYRLLLHRDTFFREKRFAFILGFLFSLVYPFIDISSWIENNEPVVIVAQSLSTTLPEIVIGGDVVKDTMLTTAEIIMLSYGFVVALLIFRIIWQTITVLILSSKGSKEEINGWEIMNLPKGTAPFSFFGMIFLNPEDYSAKDLEEILHHEGAHVKQGHTFDVMFTELVCAFFWINPATWLLKRHMRENLEYLADRDVLYSGFDPKSYQYHLLRLSYQQSTSIMANHFNVTQLKNRIVMMNKKETSLAGLGKYALSLPLFAFLMISAYAWGVKAELPTMSAIAAIAMPSVEQAPPPPPVKATKTNIAISDVKKPDTSKALLSAEIMPGYPGGDSELKQFMMNNVAYPLVAKDQNIQGIVLVRFIVSKTGEVKDAEIIKGVHPSLNNEALRLIKMMPRWKPGENKGKQVNVFFTLPISFKLAGKEIAATKKDEKVVTVVGYGSESNEKVYTSVDKMPNYPGGDAELMKYILSNLKYPASAKNKGIEGRVIIRFVINTKGEVSDVEVLRGLDPDCDNEALRVVKGMPNWIPGSQKGKEVPVFFTIPIVYRLSKDGVIIRNAEGNQPLIIVDDKEFNGKMSDVNPAEIVSMTVVKDSTAKEIYGEKGKNGVIKITLKKKPQ